ncbi:MAG: hypothetical protein BWZ01_03231 [Deltaproteobacteria bacterium ADurb.BinA179]|nr:MAG: hypothetical protein BWZ01_03231 [Deltaproteobacteria bacterium ADurb.BinA179]
MSRSSRVSPKISSLRFMGSCLNIRASMSLGCSLMTGANSIRARMSLSMSMPGATSTSSMPSFVSAKTQRSVM